MQEQVILTPQVIEQIRARTKQEWRKCQRKEYSVFAINLPEGYVFANCLEQPISYRAIMSTFHRPIITIAEAQQAGIFGTLQANGCYMSNPDRVILCGTKGELWDVKPDKFFSSYRRKDGSQIPTIDETWIEVWRAAETMPSAVGIQLPKKYLGIYQTSWATLQVNDPNSSGHGSGDILVAPMVNGQIDYSHISPINNEVFAMTFNQNVGGWNQSGLITPPTKIKPLTLDYVRNTFIKGHIGEKFSYNQVVEWAHAHWKKGNISDNWQKNHLKDMEHIIIRLTTFDVLVVYKDLTWQIVTNRNVADPGGLMYPIEPAIKNLDELKEIHKKYYRDWEI